MKLSGIGALATLFLAGCQSPQSERAEDSAPVRFGAIADCQYADQDTRGVRHYRLSPGKLKEGIAHLGEFELDFAVHLGDLIDKNFESYDVVLPILRSLDTSMHVVLGNHEFSVADEYKLAVPERLGLDQRYYDFEVKGRRFIVTDGNDLSFHAWPEGSEEHAASLAWHAADGGDKPGWNGALGPEQMRWLDGVLAAADTAGEDVFLFSHFPIYPDGSTALWNAAEIRELLRGHPSVKAWIAGHHHPGDYASEAGIHYLTLRGMVDTEENAYSTLTITDELLIVEGFARERDRVLPLR